MKEFTHFIETYGIYIWLTLVILIVSNFYFRGRAAIRKFGAIDTAAIVFSQKSASGYSTKSWKTKRSGASKLLHIIITDKELIIKSNLFGAYIAKSNDLLHRVPLQKVTGTTLKKGTLSTKLFVTFTTEKGEKKEVVLMSNRNAQIKEILDRSIQSDLTDAASR
jgi:hypothetical protein